MDLGLRGKVALVAAASRGLGRATALGLAAEGANLVLCARGAKDLESARDEIAKSTGVEIHTVVADVSNAARRRQGQRARRWRDSGRWTFSSRTPAGRPRERSRSIRGTHGSSAVNLTLRSAVEMTRAVLPGMRERKWGRVINITSIAAKQPVDMLILSNSIRAAVTGFARTLANEVATDGITVNNILPGYTRTDRVEHLADATAAKEGVTRADVVARFEREIPMRRLGEPSEFAALAVFLASRQASYITGQSIAVDGGWIKSLM